MQDTPVAVAAVIPKEASRFATKRHLFCLAKKAYTA